MQLKKRDILTKALLDTQERVRDFMNYAEQADDPTIHAFFREYAISEGLQAQRLQKFLEE
ncbi:MAG: hypothetical protein AAGU77_12150 [Bacillota bacterium]